MFFNSFQYVAFLPIVFASYWLVYPVYRNYILMFASFLFYSCWNWKYFLLFFAEIFITYFFGIKIEYEKKRGNSKGSKIWCVVCVLFSVILIFIFKYYNFTIGVIDTFFEILGSGSRFNTLNLVLPVGISFYTFQCIGYVADIYRGESVR